MNKEDMLDLVLIDKHNLDYEIGRQAKAVLDFGKKYGQAKANLADTKAAMEKEYARISLDVRMHPEQYAIDKTTDKVVDAVILTQESYQQAQSTYFKAIKDAETYKQFLYALADKKSGVHDLIDLYKMNYWSEPLVKHKDKVAIADSKADGHQKRLNDNPRIKQLKKRKKSNGKKSIIKK